MKKETEKEEVRIGGKEKISIISLSLLIPVLLDEEVPIPAQVDNLVVIHEAGTDHIMAV